MTFFSVVEAFLKHDDTVLNDEDENSNTALHMAAENGHYDVVKILCTYGADKLNRFVTRLDLQTFARRVFVRCTV